MARSRCWCCCGRCCLNCRLSPFYVPPNSSLERLIYLMDHLLDGYKSGACKSELPLDPLYVFVGCQSVWIVSLMVCLQTWNLLICFTLCACVELSNANQKSDGRLIAIIWWASASHSDQNQSQAFFFFNSALFDTHKWTIVYHLFSIAIFKPAAFNLTLNRSLYVVTVCCMLLLL